MGRRRDLAMKTDYPIRGGPEQTIETNPIKKSVRMVFWPILTFKITNFTHAHRKIII
jgi:hypothetical protein